MSKSVSDGRYVSISETVKLAKAKKGQGRSKISGEDICRLEELGVWWEYIIHTLGVRLDNKIFLVITFFFLLFHDPKDPEGSSFSFLYPHNI